MIDVVGRRTLGSVLAHHARTAPDRRFLTYEDAGGAASWTYAEFDALVNRTASALTGRAWAGLTAATASMTATPKTANKRIEPG